MSFDFALSPAARVAESIASRTTATDSLLEAGVTVASIAAGWIIARALRGRLERNPRWKFGKGGLERLAFPPLALAFAWIGPGPLPRRLEPPVLHILVSPLLALPGLRP